MKKFIVIVPVALAVGIGGQFGCFAISMQNSHKMNPQLRPDAVVVFAGEPHRTAEGFTLSASLPASTLVVSPATERQLRRFGRRYRPGRTIKYVIEDRARTTFENALFCSRIIRTHRLRSVALVTSDYHFPRSYLLLKSLLLGASVKIYRADVPTLQRRRPSDRLKIAYNETLKTWGSFGELCYYRFARRVPARPLKSYHTVHWLKSVLLFEV